MPSDANRSTVTLLPETRNSGEGTWVREPIRPISLQRDVRSVGALYVVCPRCFRFYLAYCGSCPDCGHTQPMPYYNTVTGGYQILPDPLACTSCAVPVTDSWHLDQTGGPYCDACYNRRHRAVFTRPAHDPRNRVMPSAPMDLRTPHDRLEAQVVELEGRIIELEQRLGSATDKVVCCHTRFGAPCIRWTTRVNAEDNWAYVGACYYCPQCWGHICAGR